MPSIVHPQFRPFVKFLKKPGTVLGLFISIAVGVLCYEFAIPIAALFFLTKGLSILLFAGLAGGIISFCWGINLLSNGDLQNGSPLTIGGGATLGLVIGIIVGLFVPGIGTLVGPLAGLVIGFAVSLVPVAIAVIHDKFFKPAQNESVEKPSPPEEFNIQDGVEPEKMNQPKEYYGPVLGGPNSEKPRANTNSSQEKTLGCF